MFKQGSYCDCNPVGHDFEADKRDPTAVTYQMAKTEISEILSYGPIRKDFGPPLKQMEGTYQYGILTPFLERMAADNKGTPEEQYLEVMSKML